MDKELAPIIDALSPLPRSKECVLVVERAVFSGGIRDAALADLIGGVDFVVARSLDQYLSAIAQGRFDVVVIDCQVLEARNLQLLHELKLLDHDPAVVVVSDAKDPYLMSSAYDAGCDKFLARDESWPTALAPVVRHLLRIKRLEAENHNLLAKLTEANDLLEEKNQRLDEFSATVAHDIRGPLGGISMKLEYLLDTYEQRVDRRFAELLHRTLASANRLTEIVQGMYEFARIGAQAAKREEVNLKELVSQVIADMHFEEKLQIDVGLGELPIVWGNANLLRRVFINLIGNAVKYGDKPEVLINIGTSAVLERSLASFCEVFVQDNGPGLNPNEHEEIFTMFHRGSTAEGNKDGSGIGLAVVQRIMELHYGKIRVKSRRGHGSTFYLTLPLEPIGVGG